MNKRLFTVILMSVATLSGMAQISKTLSPYSQFGLGALAEQSQGANRGMSGVGIALRDGKAVNILNPASYSAVDSLTMIFDMGVAGQLTNFKDGGKKLNRQTADFEYVSAIFRVYRKLGVSFGVVPFSNIGYSYYNTEKSADGLSLVNSYSGSGGLSQAYLGVGYEVLKGLSVGVNFSYLWGDMTKTVVNTSSETYAKVLTKTYSANINSYKIDFGLQWQQTLDKNNTLTLGATAGLGHKLGADAYLTSVTSESLSGSSFETPDSVPNAYSIPFTFGFGVALVHKNSLTIGVDYTLQKWGALDYPEQTKNISTEHKLGYQQVGGLLRDRHKIAAGADWVPNMTSRKFLKRMHYRIGVQYATPYYNINSSGHKGPREMGVSAGFGIPITNSWNNRSLLNISAQWVNTSANHFITENTFRINVGFTFNERWFAKWKVD